MPGSGTNLGEGGASNHSRGTFSSWLNKAGKDAEEKPPPEGWFKIDREKTGLDKQPENEEKQNGGGGGNREKMIPSKSLARRQAAGAVDGVIQNYQK